MASAIEEPRLPEPEPWLATALRVLVHGITGAVFAWPLTVIEGVYAGAAGAAIGALAARFLARRRVRLPALLTLYLGGLLFALFLYGRALGDDGLARALGPAGALRAGEGVLFGLASLFASLTLRTLSARRPSFGVLEVLAVGVGFSGLVLAHRNGAIHRPYEIADRFLTEGQDPRIALFGIGLAAAVVIGLLLLTERSLLRSAMHLGVLAVLLLLVAFGAASTPVPEQPDFLRNAAGGDSREDDDDEMRFDGPQDESRIPIAVVLLHEDYSPPGGVYYFRGGASSEYNGVRLVKATRSDVDQDVPRTFPSQPTQPDERPAAGSFRGTVETTVALLRAQSAPLALESPTLLSPLRNPDTSRFRRVYHVSSAALTADYRALIGRPVGSGGWSQDQWAHYTRGPEDPRYQALAEQILTRLRPELRQDKVAQALAIVSDLQARGVYSLRPPQGQGGDPTADFLFGDVIGYCVHFAHAAVFLMRSLGIPARIGTGFMSPESARHGGSALLLMSQFSHAWPEVYIDGLGWVVIDVYPERSLSPPPPPPDPQLQRLLGEMARGLSDLTPESLRPPRPLDEMVREAGAPLLRWALALLAGILLFGYLVKLARRAISAVMPGPRRIRALYRAELDRLAEAGYWRRYGESHEAFAARIRPTLPRFGALTKIHIANEFGGRLPEDGVARFLSERRVSRAELARAVPLWRRLLGLLHPYSWWLSR